MLRQYRGVLPIIRKVARECGYAIGYHGSGNRDLDVIAAPWVEGAVSAEVLIGVIREAVNGYIVNYEEVEVGDEVYRNPVHRPHGRIAWSIHIGRLSKGRYIDISVFPLKKVRRKSEKVLDSGK